MKEFLVGLLVLLMLAVFCVLGTLLFPILLVAGFFLRWLLMLFFVLFSIWLIGKLTLFLLDYLKKREGGRP